MYENEPWNPVHDIDEEEQAPVTQKKMGGLSKLKNLFGRKSKNTNAGEGTSQRPQASMDIPSSSMRTPHQAPRMSVDMGGQYNTNRDSQPSMANFGRSKICREKVDSSVGRFFYANYSLQCGQLNSVPRGIQCSCKFRKIIQSSVFL